MDNTQYITREEFNTLKNQLDSLSQQFFKNNFSASITFNKDVICGTRLKVPSYSTVPIVAEVNDIIGINGELYICTVAGTIASPATFTLVGSQV